MGGISVEIHEPVNVLSTMLLALTGGAKDAKPHPIASAALAHVRTFDQKRAWYEEMKRNAEERLRAQPDERGAEF